MTPAFKRILVRGCPRSGNTMLYAMLSSCFEGVTQLKGEHIPIEARISNYDKVTIAKYPRPVSKRILGDEYDASRDFLTTPPEDALLIFIVRDPRDALMSKHGSFGSEPFLKSASAWFSVIEEIQKIKDRHNVLVLRYEDIIADPDSIQRKIAHLSGLKMSGTFSNFNEMVKTSGAQLTKHNLGELNGLRPVDSSRVFAYRNEPREVVQPIVEKILEFDNADKLVRSFGYEPLR